mgnify:CR=1 FL=1
MQLSLLVYDTYLNFPTLLEENHNATRDSKLEFKLCLRMTPLITYHLIQVYYTVLAKKNLVNIELKIWVCETGPNFPCLLNSVPPFTMFHKIKLCMCLRVKVGFDCLNF